jgi:hypothetical protein
MSRRRRNGPAPGRTPNCDDALTIARPSAAALVNAPERAIGAALIYRDRSAFEPGPAILVLPMSGSATPRFGTIKRSRRGSPTPRSLRPVRRARVSTRSGAVMAHAIEATPFQGRSRAGCSRGAETGARIRADLRAPAASRHPGTVVDACHLVGFDAGSRSWPSSLPVRSWKRRGAREGQRPRTADPRKASLPQRGSSPLYGVACGADLPD